MLEHAAQSANVKNYTIVRATGTHGDIFAAAGLADLLEKASHDGEVRIVDRGYAFEISTPDNLALDQIPSDPGYPYIKTENEDTSQFPNVVDYKAESGKAKRYNEYQSSSSKKRKNAGPEIQEQLRQDEPRPDWPLIQALKKLQGFKTTNGVYRYIVKRRKELFLEVKGALNSLANFSPSGLKWGASLVQLFTPNAAKGYARLKPDSTDRNDDSKEKWIDSFIEWLRYRGYFVVACPRFHKKDVRLLCPMPKDIEINAFREVVGELRQIRIVGGPTKVDIHAALKLAELLIRHSKEFYDKQTPCLPFLSLLNKSPADVISGISVTNYQSMGQANAVTAIFTVALPGWFKLTKPDDAQVFLNILDEHWRCVSSLNDDHSDEVALLVEYRRFLEARGSHSLPIFVDFMCRYGALVLRAREQGRKLPQFTTTNFERLVMNNEPKWHQIVQDPGFQAVARAIRNATVKAQWLKANNRDHREIHYDLIPELLRKSALPGNEFFIQALSNFICSYNRENARLRELKKPAHRDVTTEELEAMIKLIEDDGAATVGPLLCAYATCREPKEKDPELEAREVESETPEAEEEE